MTKKLNGEGNSKRSDRHLRVIKKARRNGNGGVVVPIPSDWGRRMGCQPGDELILTLKAETHLYVVKNKKSEGSIGQ